MPRPDARRCHAAEVKEAILKAYEAGEDWKNTARTLNLKIQTCRTWIQNRKLSSRRGTHGGVRRQALTELQVDSIIEWVAEDPKITLDVLRSRLECVFNVIVSRSTIGRYLDGQLVAVKKCTASESVNTLEVKQQRKAYVLDAMHLESEGRRFVWIDELNLRLFTKRYKKRSVRGIFTGCNRRSNRGFNLHIVGAMSKDKLIAFSLVRGSFSTEACAQWLRELVDANGPTFLKECVLICDSAPCHAGLEIALRENPYHDGRLLRLCPYSPALNPLEGVWSVIRPRVSESLRIRRSEMTDDDPAGVLSRHEWRMRILEQVVNEARVYVTPHYCQQMVEIVLQNHTRALSCSDL